MPNTTEKKATPAKVITEEVRFSYLNVFEPKGVGDSPDKKYSVSLILDKKKNRATIKLCEAAIEFVKNSEAAKGVWKAGGKIPKDLKLPLRDGDSDRDNDDVYKGAMFVNASAKTKPGLVEWDESVKEFIKITDSTKMYSGCYGKASINFYAFNKNGNKGIACGLNNLQFLRDGEPLGGRSKAEDDFAVENSDDL